MSYRLVLPTEPVDGRAPDPGPAAPPVPHDALQAPLKLPHEVLNPERYAWTEVEPGSLECRLVDNSRQGLVGSVIYSVRRNMLWSWRLHAAITYSLEAGECYWKHEAMLAVEAAYDSRMAALVEKVLKEQDL